MPARSDANHFLALRLDDDTHDRLAAVAERLRAWDLPARWVHPDDFHLTVAFLGPVDADEAGCLPAALDEVAGSQRRPTLAFTGLGAGGDNGHDAPKYVFAAAEDGEGTCAALRDDLHAALEMKPDAGFRPHVTLCRPQAARMTSPQFRDWPHLLEAHGLAHWGPCVTTDIVLYRSSGTGATRYETLASWKLL